MADCTCPTCMRMTTPAPVANGGMYTVRHGKLDANGEEWNVIGPSHPFPHVCCAWGCPSKSAAISLAEKMNRGFIPPMLDICDKCGRSAPIADFTFLDTPKARLGICSNCR